MSIKIPTRDEAFNEIAERIVVQNDIVYKDVMNKPEDNGYVTGFLACREWIINMNK